MVAWLKHVNSVVRFSAVVLLQVKLTLYDSTSILLGLETADQEDQCKPTMEQ